MPIVPITDVGKVGIIEDIPSYNLPPNAWSGGNNVRFLDNGVKKVDGYGEVMATCPFAPYYIQPYLDSGGTYYWIAYGATDIAVWDGSTWTDVVRQATGTLNGTINNSVTTITLADASGFPTSGTIAMGSEAIADGSSNGYEEVTYSGKSSNDLTGCGRGANSTTPAEHTSGSIVTPVSDTSTSDNNYGANTTTKKWTATNLNGIVIATNGYDTPQYWPLSAGVPSLTIPFRELRNWPATSNKCEVIRSFRTFLVGLNWDRTNQEPRLVKWSTEATYGNVPTTWSEADNTLDAGEYQLADTPGEIVDGLPLGDSFLIYKKDAIYIMNYVGTPYIFSFKLLSPNIGCLSKNCVAEFEGGHFFIGLSDFYLCNGQQVTPLLPEKLRRAVFNDLDGDDDNFNRCFVAADYVRNEMIAAYPSTSGTSGGPADKAVIWNWKTNTFSIRDLPEASHIKSGIIEITAGTTWNNITGSWNAGSGAWGSTNYGNVSENLVFAEPGVAASITGATKANPVVITAASHGLSDGDVIAISGVGGMVELNGNTYTVAGATTNTFQLSGINGTGYTTYTSGGQVARPKLYRDNHGNTKDGTNMTSYIERTGYDLGDPSIVKYVSSVYPELEVSGSNSVNVYVGHQMSTEEAVTWEGPVLFNPNTQSKVSCRASGKYFGVKVESTGDFNWKLNGLAFDVKPRGKRGKRSY